MQQVSFSILWKRQPVQKALRKFHICEIFHMVEFKHKQWHFKNIRSYRKNLFIAEKLLTIHRSIAKMRMKKHQNSRNLINYIF